MKGSESLQQLAQPQLVDWVKGVRRSGPVLVLCTRSPKAGH